MNSDLRLVLHYNDKHKLQEEVNVTKQGEKHVEAAITKQDQPKVPNADANKKKGETDTGRFECHVCLQRFISDLDLAFHLADAHNLTILDLDFEKQKVFACPACEAKFKTLELAIEHVNREHSNIKKKGMISVQYTCSYCKSALKTPVFKQHLVRCAISFGQLRCRYCLVDIAAIKFLQEHVTTKHPTEELDIIRCPVCRKEYVSKEALLRHSQIRHPLRIRKNAPPVSLKRTLTISQRDGKNYYKCPFCNFACPVLPVTVKHILAKHENRKDEISDKVSMGMFGGTIRGSNSMSSNYSNLAKRAMGSNEPLTHNLPGPSSTNTDMSEKRRRSDIAAPYQTFGTAKSVNKYEVTKPYDSRSAVLGSSERRQFYGGGAESRISPWLCDASHGYGSRPFKTDVQSGVIGFACIVCGQSYMSRAALDMHMKVNHEDMCSNTKTKINNTDKTKNEASKADPTMIVSGNKDEVQKSSEGSPPRNVNPNITSVTLDNGVCALCDKKFDSKKDLLRHLLTTHRSVIEASKKLRCKSCNNDIDNMQKHLETVHKLKGSLCPICVKSFSKSNEVVNHYKTSHLQVLAKLSCAICKLVYANIEDLILHYQDKHEIKQKHVNGRDDIQIETAEGEVESSTTPTKENEKASVQGISRARTETRKSSSEVCTLCENKFDSEESLRQHYLAVHRSYITETKTWRCHECSTIFNTEEDVQKHLESEHKVGGNFCPICNKGFITKLEASKHLRSLHIEDITKLSCSFCRLDFSNQDHLILHCQYKHGNGSKKEINSRIDENKTEPVIWRCKNCVTTFTDTEEDMKQHLEMDHKIEESCCPVCDKHFSTALEVTEHLQKIHVEVITKPVCAICKLECTNRDDLMSHYQDKHADIAEKNKTGHILCILCEIKFKSNLAMVRHCRSAHPEVFNESKVWICKTCESGFITTEESIQKHMKNKHKVRDALCPICKIRFSTHLEAVEHVKSSHVELVTKPSCSVCKVTMKSDLRLVLHYNDKHKLQEDVNIRKQGEKPVEAAITKQDQPKVPNADANKKKGETDTERFECHVCSQRFIRDLDLAFHLADGHNLTILDLDLEKQKVFACSACAAKFKTMELALEHVRKHSKKIKTIFVQYICSYCKSALNTSIFQQHLVRCAISFGQLRCRYCLIDIANKELLQEHVTTKHPTEEDLGLEWKSKSLDPHYCPVCERKFGSKEALLCHSRIKHPVKIRKDGPPVPLESTLTRSHKDGKTFYRCPFCNYTCPKLPLLMKHIVAKHKIRKSQISDQVSVGMTGGTIQGPSSKSSDNSNLRKRTMTSNEPLPHNLPGPSSTNTDMSEKRRRSDIAAPYQTFGTTKSVNKYEVTKPYDSRSAVVGSSERRQFYGGGAESSSSPWLGDASHGSRPFKTVVESGVVRYECTVCGQSYMSRAALDMHMKVNHEDM